MYIEIYLSPPQHELEWDEHGHERAEADDSPGEPPKVGVAPADAQVGARGHNERQERRCDAAGQLEDGTEVV